MASPHARALTPAVQHRKAMGDFHRKETARVLSTLRRSKQPLTAQSARHDATTALVYPSSTRPRTRVVASSTRSLPRSVVALAALTLSLATLAAYALIVLLTSTPTVVHEA